MLNDFNTRTRGGCQLHFKTGKWASWSCPDGGQFRETLLAEQPGPESLFSTQLQEIQQPALWRYQSILFGKACLTVPSPSLFALFLKHENNCYQFYYVQKWHKKKIKVAYSGTQKLENNGITVALTTFPSPSPAPSLIPGNGWTTLLKL